MNKGERTREMILNRGMLQSSQHGLADITIGSISKLCGLSRTGVISHFKNKDDMQIAILDYSESQFIEHVIHASRDDDAFTRLSRILDLWVAWTGNVFGEDQTSCPFIKAIVDYEHRQDSPVRDHAFKQQSQLLGFFSRLIEKAQSQGTVLAGLNPDDVAFELYSLYVGMTITASLRSKPSDLETVREVLRQALARIQN